MQNCEVSFTIPLLWEYYRSQSSKVTIAKPLWERSKSHRTFKFKWLD